MGSKATLHARAVFLVQTNILLPQQVRIKYDDANNFFIDIPSHDLIIFILLRLV